MRKCAAGKLSSLYAILGCILQLFWTPIQAADRIAFVIGNGAYTDLGVLSNTANDAQAMADALTSMGYETKLALNLQDRDLRRELSRFAKRSERADTAVLFYAGHGVQVGGENFLLPVDAEIPQNETDIRLSGLKVDDLVAALKSRIRVVILDACRENPIVSRSLSRGRSSGMGSGLAPVRGVQADSQSSGGIFIAYATEAGNIALDGDSKHSPFTEALLRHIEKPMSIDDMFSLVTRDVRLATNNTQRPYKYASLESIVCLAGSCQPPQLSAATVRSERQYAGGREPSFLSTISTLPNKNSEALQNDFKQKAIEASLKSISSWIKFDSKDKSVEYFYQPSSIVINLHRVYGRFKGIYAEDTAPRIGEARISEIIDDQVFDCQTNRTALAETASFDSSGKRIGGRVVGDARTLKIETEIKPGTIAEALRVLFCNPLYAGRLVGSDGLNSPDWIVIGETADGSERVSLLPSSAHVTGDHTIILLKGTAFSPRIEPKSGKTYTNSLNLMSLNCQSKEFAMLRTESVDDTGLPLFRTPVLPVKFDSIIQGTVADRFFQLVCGRM